MPDEMPMKRLILLLIKTYQLTMSPFLGRCCRFHPSCSAYALQAVERHGTLTGCWLTVRRIARCHPWHPGGEDPVPPLSRRHKPIARRLHV